MDVSSLLNPVNNPQLERMRQLIDTTLEQSRVLSNSLYSNPWAMVVAKQDDVWTVKYNTHGSVLKYELLDTAPTPTCIMSKVEGTSGPIPPGVEEVLFIGVPLEGTDSDVMNRIAMAHALHKHHQSAQIELHM